MTEFTSDAASGENGYLIDKGLIPLPAEQHRQMQTVAERLAPLEPTLR